MRQTTVRRHSEAPTYPGRIELIAAPHIVQEADAFKTAPYNGNRSALAARIDDQYLTDVVPRFFASELPQPVHQLVLPCPQRHSLGMHFCLPAELRVWGLPKHLPAQAGRPKRGRLRTDELLTTVCTPAQQIRPSR